MKNDNGCLICGLELVYTQSPEKLKCSFCGNEFMETVKCSDGHYICNTCHSSGPNDVIAQFCRNTNLTDPIQMAEMIMSHPGFNMHGPEHHFLVPAVLIAAYYNLRSEPQLKKEKLLLARQRSEKIPGGFCGSHGNCGAGVGTGIFFSIITGTTPLSGKTWKLSNLLTGTCLVEIAKKGGPRCCKRDTFTAIQHTLNFIKENLDVTIPARQDIKCKFHAANRQCLRAQCEYYPG
jgi:hypothetical protein